MALFVLLMSERLVVSLLIYQDGFDILFSDFFLHIVCGCCMRGGTVKTTRARLHDLADPPGGGAKLGDSHVAQAPRGARIG